VGTVAKLGAMVDELYKIKLKKDELSKKLDALSEDYNEVQEELLEAMKAGGVDKVGGKSATISLSSAMVPTVKDWDKVYAYIMKHKAFDLLQRRLSTEAWRERLDVVPVPGVETFKKTNVSLRKKS
jgi:hypothetical protein